MGDFLFWKISYKIAGVSPFDNCFLQVHVDVYKSLE